jgi:peroxiredoxin
MRAETKTLHYLKKTPFYKLTAHTGQIVAQHHYTGHTHAIVYFLESAENPRCRSYCQELGQQVNTAKFYKTVILGIAPEPVERLAVVHQEMNLPFPLLSDSGSEVAARYGLLLGRWYERKRLSPAVVVHDKYGIAYFIAVPEKPEERPAWAEIEAALKRFPRG